MADRRTVMPFGPQHPVLLEPLQLRLVLEDEKVVEALPAMGYMHRGLERLVAKKDFQKMLYVAERISGVTSFMYGLAYAMAMEKMLNIEVPERAAYLRVIWGELTRLQSHFLWMSSLANAMGLESLSMLCLRVREQILDIVEETSGSRMIISTNIIGGMRCDIGPDGLAHIRNLCDYIEGALGEIRPVVLSDYTVKKRTVGIGILSKEQAQDFAVVGPVMRASGVVEDIRQQGYAAYSELQFVPAAESDGDSYARMLVRFNEMVEGVGLLRSAMVKITPGEIATSCSDLLPTGEVAMRIEDSRGELFYYLKADGSKYLQRMQVRSPSHANLPALLAMLPGSQLTDVPVIIASFDLTVGCIER
jgi:Ni,Fe-hydrogenase III large subunit